jgi:hypothetical protein
MLDDLEFEQGDTDDERTDCELHIDLIEKKIIGKNDVQYGIVAVDDNGRCYVNTGWLSIEAFKKQFPTLQSILKDVEFGMGEFGEYTVENGAVIMSDDPNNTYAEVIVSGSEIYTATDVAN